MHALRFHITSINNFIFIVLSFSLKPQTCFIGWAFAVLPAHVSRFTRATAFSFIWNPSCRNIAGHKYLFSVTRPQTPSAPHARTSQILRLAFISPNIFSDHLSHAQTHQGREQKNAFELRKTLLNDWSRNQRAKSHPMKKEISSLDLGGRGECLEELFSCKRDGRFSYKREDETRTRRTVIHAWIYLFSKVLSRFLW